VIDDERLQELLSKASSLYNNGEYKGAIEAWQEALSVDPASQKAREGIRMATLLLGDFDAPGPAAPSDEAEAPADGGTTSPEGLPPEELEARLDLGIARIKQLMAERKHAEAIEGAQGLLPLRPESEEIQRLLEEVQQAFEAAPFIEEHLTLARELLEQERFPEAEEECKKIFALDAAHPRGRALLAEIRGGTQRSLQRAASQLGGMTVKLNLADVMKKEGGAAAAAPKPPGSKAGAAKAGAAKGGTAARPAAPDPRAESLAEEVILDAGDEPPIALARPSGGTAPGEAEEVPGQDAAGPEPGPFDTLPETTGEAARAQEDVASRSLLDDAFAQAGVGEEPPAGGPAALEGLESGIETSAPEPPAAAPPEEFVEAKTVVKPSVRLAPAAPQNPEPAKPKPAPRRADAKPPAGPPAPATEGVADWEKELTQLNLKVGERELLKGTGAKAAASAAEGAEADLMSLLDTDLGGPAGAAVEGGEAGNVRSIPLAGPGTGAAAAGGAGKENAAAKEKKPAPAWTVKKTREVLAAEAAAEAAIQERPRERRRPVQVVVRRRSSGGRWLFLLLLLAAGGGGAWWFYLRPGAAGLPPEITGLLSYLRPGAAGGAGSPQQPVAPPAGSSSGVTADAGQGPIPTPIGGPSRPAAQDGQGGAADGSGEPPGGGGGAAGDPSSGPAGGAASVAAAPVRPAKLEPIKPAGTKVPLSPAEIRRRLAYYSSDGRRLMSLGKLREARAKFNAALALDPADFELKELVDQVQSKIDEEQHLLDDFESAKQFFNDRDYENALRKLYRLPRDKGLGDIDLYIRNAWYNWAVIAAKGGNATDTLKKLQELLEVDPDDADALKLQEVAEHYLSRAKDRVYYAFAEKLKLRAIDQR
jgi:tetratricopeptide (TPR) repeat protein